MYAILILRTFSFRPERNSLFLYLSHSPSKCSSFSFLFTQPLTLIFFSRLFLSLSLFLLFQPGSLFSHARIYVFLCSLQGSSHALCHIVRTFGAPLSPCKSVITTRGEAPRRGSSSFSLNGRRATPVGTER